MDFSAVNLTEAVLVFLCIGILGYFKSWYYKKEEYKQQALFDIGVGVVVVIIIIIIRCLI